jgi:formate C-acetyltransferase
MEMPRESRRAWADRIERLKADVLSRQSPLPQHHNSRRGSWLPDGNPWTRNVALYRAWRPGMSVGEVRAATLLELVRLSEARLFPEWRIAGEHFTCQSFTSFDDPKLQEKLPRLAEFDLGEEDIPAMKDTQRRWHETSRGATFSKVGLPAFDRGPEERDDRGNTVYMSVGWVENHSIRDYPKLLRVGYAGLRAEIEAAMAACDISDAHYAEREAFWRAGLLVCDAGILLGQRYAALARAEAEACTCESERERLLGIAECCERVPAHGARTLREATQALWFGHLLTCGEDGINANSLGRLDQFLQPYYTADLAAGRMDCDEALELMAELTCKFYLDYDVQAITLAGRDAAGNDLANEMTYLILEATEQVGVLRDLSVRVHRDSPERLLRQCAGMIARGGGIPYLFNDDCFIPALTERGIRPEHVGDYSPIGCIELTIPGKANPHAVSGWFHLTKCLELALFNGRDPVSQRQLGPATGEFVDFADFDAFLAAYKVQVEHLAKHMVYLCNRGALRQREGGPLPCWSVLTDDCIARGLDITDGGPLYNYHSICLLGTANTADSLCALRKLVFQEKKVDRQELLAALAANFDGHEPLRQLLLNGAPKYGNDCDEADELAQEVDNHFIDLMDAMRSPLDGRYVVHLFSFLLNIGFGHGLGATPDGRRAGEPIAYSLSAQQGRDAAGATAMLRSLAKLPHHRAAGASAAILDLDPKLLEGDAGVERLAQLLRSAIQMGVGQLQLNVTTEERLRQAQEDPETYGNIPVRVAGYSQLFRLLGRELQDHVIARTKHRS